MQPPVNDWRQLTPVPTPPVMQPQPPVIQPPPPVMQPPVMLPPVMPQPVAQPPVMAKPKGGKGKGKGKGKGRGRGRGRKAAGGLTQEGYLEGVGQGISDQFSFGGEEEGSLSLISELLQGNITPEAKARRKEMEDVPSFGYKGGDVERISDVISNSSQDVADDMTKENMMTDPITQEVVLFILGESENEQAIEQFISKYGNEAFMQLRNSVLQSITNPDVQTEGLIEGTGQGGMSDDINGTLGNQEKIAVSQDEFIVPADVVSGIGDGSSNSGAEELYAMMDRVRQAKTGTTQQAPRLANAGGYLPA